MSILFTQETKLYLGNAESYVKIFLTSSNNDEDQQDFCEKLMEINNSIIEKVELCDGEITRLKNILPRWRNFSIQLTKERDWLGSVSSLMVDFDSCKGSLQEFIPKYSAIVAKADDALQHDKSLKTINEKVKKLQQSQNMEIIDLKELMGKCHEMNSKLLNRFPEFTGHSEDLLKGYCTSMQLFTDAVKSASILVSYVMIYMLETNQTIT